MAYDGDGVRTGGNGRMPWVAPVAMVVMLAMTVGIIVVSWVTGNVLMAGIGVLIVAMFVRSLFTSRSRGTDT